jgi:hypothetical protein
VAPGNAAANNLHPVVTYQKSPTISSSFRDAATRDGSRRKLNEASEVESKDNEQDENRWALT